jgi:DNA topoisomerase I
MQDLARDGLDRDRVAASAVRLIDLGLFRVGGEKYAALDHHYGATTLEKRHLTLTRDGMKFDYIAKEGKRRTISITDEVVIPTMRALARSRNGLDTLFSYQHGDDWRVLHSHDVSNYIAARAGGHFTAKEFRTWNATVLMALALANAAPSRSARSRERVIAASIREVAGWLGDTPAVARKSYIDPQLISRYESAGELPAIPSVPVALPAPAEAETAVAALLAGGPQQQAPCL